MNILALDTSGPVCGVALLSGGAVVYECAVRNKKTHSVNLVPMVEGALAATGFELNEMDCLAAVVGPGSFTGVRIGVSTAKGLCHGSGKPCVPVNALEALAAGAGDFPGVVCPIQDARAGQVYGAAFTVEGGVPERLLPDRPMMLEDFLREALAIGEPLLFLGDGMPVHRQRIRELAGEAAVFAEAPRAFLRPAAVAALAASRPDTAVDYLSLQPLYLRAPSAERNRRLMEAAGRTE